MCAFILIDDYIIISIFRVCAIMDYQFYDLISVNVRVCNCFIYIITKLHILLSFILMLHYKFYAGEPLSLHCIIILVNVVVMITKYL